MKNTAFDYPRFSKALKAKIGDRSLREVAKETDADHYVIHRVLHEKGASIDNIIILCAWMERPFEDFIKTKYKI